MGHLGIVKTLKSLQHHFYWPRMRKYVEKLCIQCVTCKQAKATNQTKSMYMPLLIPYEPWVNISIDFVLGLP